MVRAVLRRRGHQPTTRRGTQLIELRATVVTAYREYQADARVGFVPRTFAASAISRFDLGLSGLDHILVTFAAYLKIQTAAGTWAEGPTGRWHTYDAIYKGATQ